MRILEDDHQASAHYPVLLVAIAALAILTLSAWQTLRQSAVGKYDHLAVAGFLQRPAHIPGREMMHPDVPTDRCVEFAPSGGSNAVYSAPLRCNCLYAGSRRTYSQHAKRMPRHRPADEARLTASIYFETGRTGSNRNSG